MSSWEVSFKRKLNRAFSPAHVIVEFERTKPQRIFSHILGKINFNNQKDLNKTRDEVIQSQKENKDINGFVFKQIGHTYLDAIEIPENDDGSYTIYAHGAGVGGTNYAGLENCHVEGMKCATDEGTDQYCNAGKCIIGRVYRESDFKWRYESESSFPLKSDPFYSEKAIYYVGGKEVLSLKNVIRGDFQNAPIDKKNWSEINLSWDSISQVGSIDQLNSDLTYSNFSYQTSNKIRITTPASKYTKFYIPPKFFYNQNFVQIALSRLDQQYNGQRLGLDDLVSVFIKQVLVKAYPTATEGLIEDKANDYPEEIIKEILIDAFYELKSVWKEKTLEIIEEEWVYRYNNIYDAKKYIQVVAERVADLFTHGIQITKSSISPSQIRLNTSSNDRPVYFRLPGTTEGYRKTETNDILFVKTIEERLKLDVEALDIGTIVTAPDRKIAYRFYPRRITSTALRKKYGMSPVISSEEKKEIYSSADALSWSLMPLDQLPDVDVSKFLTSGIDEFLVDKKDTVDNFYRDFLDPDTCDPQLLNWLAQHLGLFGELWNELWSTEIKSTMIKNAFGWWDRNSTVSLPGNREILTEKGKNLSQEPFNNDSIWTEDETLVNNLSIDFSKIETIVTDLDNIKSILGESKYTLKEYDEVNKKIQESYSDTVLFSKELWNGLFEAKGNILVIAFLSSLMGLKAPSAKELEILNIGVSDGEFINKVLRPRSGLRDVEQTAPPLLPYKPEVIQVGDETDAQINNFPNQLIAGVSRVSSVEESKNVVFRVPYYYNKDGKSWDRVNYIAKNWLPNNLNTHIQYPYLSASLWAVGDLFFEPEILVDSIFESPLITSEDGEFYLTTEKGNALNYD